MKASKQISESLPIMILLTLSGGFMDAYSYLCRGEVFANAQTGNILLFGVNLSMGHWSKALQYVCPVLAFAIGIAAAEFVRRKFTNRKHVHWRQIIVFCEAVILFGVMFIPQELNLLANSLTSLACGAQVESFRKFKEKFNKSKGVCLKHMKLLVDTVPKSLKDSQAAQFLACLFEKQETELSRIQQDIHKFTLKFDYRNKDADWKSSRDAIQRGMQKLKGGYPADPAYKMSK